jgi:hypothetical protein
MHNFFLGTPSLTHCSQYLYDTHKFMKTLLTYHGIGIIVEVPIQAKMDYDGKDLAEFQFGSTQESEIESPLFIDSIWDCPGITLDTIEDDDGKTILGWRCGHCLIPSNHGGSRIFKYCNASKALLHRTKGKDIVICTGLRHIPPKYCPCLNRIEIFKGK